MAKTAQQKRKIKLVEKEKKKKTAGELIKKSEKALGEPILLEMVINSTALSNQDGKISLTKVYNQAFNYVFDKTQDLKKAKEFAVSARWLAMLKRDYPADFEELLYEKEMREHRESVIEKDLAMKYQKPESKPEPKDVEKFDEIEFEIPKLAELISREGYDSSYSNVLIKRRFIRFPYDDNFPSLVKIHDYVWKFCVEILKKLPKVPDLDRDLGTQVLENLIEILEEKFEVKIRRCINCNNCSSGPGYLPNIYYNCAGPGCQNDPSEFSCDKWILRESQPEKKEEKIGGGFGDF